MEFDPDKYSSTSFDSVGPARKLIDILRNDFINKSSLKDRPIRILDLGCGPGNVSMLLAESFPLATVIGLDIDPKMIRYGNENRRDERCQFFVQDLNKPYEKWPEDLRKRLHRQIDVVFSNYALQWVNPATVVRAVREVLRPETGLMIAAILYSDILSVIDRDTEEGRRQLEIINRYMNFPDERRFIGDWVWTLKEAGMFHDIWLRYDQPRSIYPERYYKESFVNIPLKWHESFIVDGCPTEIRVELSKTLKSLILKKRIKRIIPRQQRNGSTNPETNAEQNDIEIQQQIWILVARPSPEVPEIASPL